MNQTTEALYLALLNSGKLETEATQTAFCEAYDYIIDLAECDSNEEEKTKSFICWQMWKPKPEKQHLP